MKFKQLSQWLPRFIIWLKKEDISEGTKEQYFGAITKFFKGYARHKNEDSKKLIERLLSNDDELIKEMNEVLRTRKRNYNKAAFMKLLEFLGKENLYIKLRKVGKVPVKSVKKYISFPLLRKFVSSIRDEQLKMIIRVQYDTAQRSSDILSLVYGDLEWGHRASIHLLTRKTREEGIFYLSASTTAGLRNYLDKKFKVGEKERVGMKLFDETYVQYLNNLKKESTKFFGYSITTHFFRALRVSHLAREKVNIETIKKQLGALDEKTALKYVKMAGIDVKETMEQHEPDW
jgi:integrase